MVGGGTDDFYVDDLYCLNFFYRGSKGLVAASLPKRSLLTATALVETALHHFQLTALLLSDYVDVLHELLHYSIFDERGGDDSRSMTIDLLTRRINSAAGREVRCDRTSRRISS